MSDTADYNWFIPPAPKDSINTIKILKNRSKGSGSIELHYENDRFRAKRMATLFVTIKAVYLDVVIKNIWGFIYNAETRTLILKRYKKSCKQGNNPCQVDTFIKVIDKETFDQALGTEYDRLKVLHIAKAKALQFDINMKYNEVDCITITFEGSDV